MTNKYQRNAKIIYVFSFLKGLMFFLPIYALYLETELFSVLNVAIILSIQSLSSFIFEVPSGAFADLFGRKKTLIISSMLSIIALIFLGIGGSFFVFVVYAILNALANSLLSGTDTAILFDSIKDKKLFKKVVGINQSMWPLGAALGSILGGFIATYSFSLTAWLTIIPFTLALVTIFFIKEPFYKKESHKNILKHMLQTTKFILQKKQILLLSLAGLMFYAFGEVAYQLKPIFFVFKGIPLEYFGFIVAGISAISFTGFYLSHTISEYFGNKKTILLTTIFPPIVLLASVFAPGLWSAVLFILGSLGWGIRWPVITYLLNKEVDSKKRATVLSVGNLANELGFSLFMPFFGYIVDLYSIAVAFKLTATLSFLIVFVVLGIKDKK